MVVISIEEAIAAFQADWTDAMVEGITWSEILSDIESTIYSLQTYDIEEETKE